MARARDNIIEPKTFFLNEQHELSSGEVPGGGRLPKLAPIDWDARAQSVSGSLRKVQKKLDESPDPLSKRRYFVLAQPVQSVKKETADKRKAPEGVFEEEPDYAGSDYSRVFQRLGLDLLQVNNDGTAVVHALPERMAQLIKTSSSLPDVGAREQSRWASINGFGTIPTYVRADSSWLRELPSETVTDVVFELQPLLSRKEAQDVLEAIVFRLRQAGDGKLTGTGTDYSGRMWYRGLASRTSIRRIAHELFSLQSIHAPLYSAAASSRRSHGPGSRTAHESTGFLGVEPSQVQAMPIVAVVDDGIPMDHPILSNFRRGTYRSPAALGRHRGHHGSRVASRVVFGDPPSYEDATAAHPTCRFYDANVAVSTDDFDDKSVVRAMEAIVSTAPDVRVFNLSFDSRSPLEQFSEVERHERLVFVQDLDNFLFANDVIAVVAAGNSPRGVIPSTPYPDHYDEPEWSLGHWSRSFNSLTCGATVEHLNPAGLVQHLGWPSPFTRCGPGLCQSQKPDFISHGGNLDQSYGFAPGLGVWCCNERGQWEDSLGTSYAAPLLAREAAFALQTLNRFCRQDALPFSVTAKAYLALTARPPVIEDSISELVSRACGRGYASSERILRPDPNTVTMVWQGVIDGPKESIRVQLPIPHRWIESAAAPTLRVVVSWDPPVNAAAHHVWACRRVVSRLRPDPDGRAVRPRRGSHHSYPLTDREYDLKRYSVNANEIGDQWTVEIAYEQIADYYPGIDFSPQQRVAFAAELWDGADEPVSPQSFLQALPIAETMNRLSVPPTVVRTPVIVRV